MTQKPKVNSQGEKELDRIEGEFKEFDNQVKAMTVENMNSIAKEEVEPQTKLSQQDIEKSKDIYLKPVRSIASKEKFNEDYRKQFEFGTEYVRFIAENREIIGEELDLWTKPFPGMPAQEWKVPVNKPVWGPRHLAEQIKKCRYHRLVMQENKPVGGDWAGTYVGTMIANSTIQRLDAIPVSSSKSVFMSAFN